MWLGVEDILAPEPPAGHSARWARTSEGGALSPRRPAITEANAVSRKLTLTLREEPAGNRSCLKGCLSPPSPPLPGQGPSAALLQPGRPQRTAQVGLPSGPPSAARLTQQRTARPAWVHWGPCWSSSLGDASPRTGLALAITAGVGGSVCTPAWRGSLEVPRPHWGPHRALCNPLGSGQSQQSPGWPVPVIPVHLPAPVPCPCTWDVQPAASKVSTPFSRSLERKVFSSNGTYWEGSSWVPSAVPPTFPCSRHRGRLLCFLCRPHTEGWSCVHTYLPACLWLDTHTHTHTHSHTPLHTAHMHTPYHTPHLLQTHPTLMSVSSCMRGLSLTLYADVELLTPCRAQPRTKAALGGHG